MTSNLEWLTHVLQVYEKPHKSLRRSSIIGTIGPRSNSVEMITNLRKAGLNILRINFSHGEHKDHKLTLANAAESEKIYTGRPLALALDTKGPEIRTGNTREGGDYPIPSNHEMLFSTNEKYSNCSDDKVMYLDYKNITKIIAPGKFIYVDDGLLSFQVLEIIDNETLRVMSVNAGFISSHKGVNLPGTAVDLPALSEKDKDDLKFGIEQGFHMIFASFIRTANDIKEIRECLGEKGKHIPIISKIENQQGVDNFDEILKETDGVMIARGDLGIEVEAAHVFVIQKKLIAKCNLAGKPVICATQMLESMTYNPRPTRAEVSDVGNAILDGADCVMLSGETAKGLYPVESVLMMHNTALIAEKAIAYGPRFDEMTSIPHPPADATETVAMAAVSAAYEQDSKAIVVLSTSGSSARLVAKYRPNCPIIMITRNETSAKYAHLYRGVYPFIHSKVFSKNWQEDVDIRLRKGISDAIDLGIVKTGDSIVTIQGYIGGSGHTNTLRMLIA